MKTKKDFDAVEMMREIREMRRLEYEKNPRSRENRLVEIRKKYLDILKNQKITSHKL